MAKRMPLRAEARMRNLRQAYALLILGAICLLLAWLWHPASPLGVLVLIAKRAEDSIRQQEMELISLLSKQGSLAVENARLTTIDPLTGLHNRRAMDAEMHRQFRAVKRYSRPLSIIMLDVDHFKQINDTYGHIVGDRVFLR